MFIIYKMGISFEMSKILEELKYDDDGNFDIILYNICRKLYNRQRLTFEEISHITALDDIKKESLFNYINVCFTSIKDKIKQ